MPTVRAVRAVAVRHADGLPLLPALREALSGAGPALAPHAHDVAADPLAAADLGPGEDEPDDPTAVVVSTTGSTGRAKHVLLPASALLASAGATHDHLGGSGRWLLALPAHTVAGVQVLVRSLVAGTRPQTLDLSGGFDPGAFAAAAALTTGAGGRCYTSLVPTQLRRVLHDGQRGPEALRNFDAVLVGGAALDPGLRAQAEDRGVRVVATYGMTETCGGCVYDGVPLPGVVVRTEPLGHDGDGDDGDGDGDGDGRASTGEGRVVLGGPVLARGYRTTAGPGAGRTEGGEGFRAGAGGRWFATADRGSWRDGRLLVAGRTDDVVVSGGVNVALDAVTRHACTATGVAEAVAVGVPDPEWGQAVALLVVLAPGADRRSTVDGVRAAVLTGAGRAAVPRLFRTVGALPLTGVGKPDRVAARALFSPATTGTTDLSDHGGTDDAPTEEPYV